MNTSPKIFNKKIDSNKIDTETVFAKRRRNSNDEESSHWLISFADLMTILLVFSFALFMVNINESGNKNPNREKTSKSLVTTAHANSNESINRAPVFIDNDPKEQSEPVTMERTILKKHLNFPSESSGLRNNHIIDLKEFADLSKSNQDSKIIIGVSKENNPSLMKNAVRIVEHLAKTEGINKSRVYIQTASEIILPDKYKELSTDSILEVKIIKSFWWF
jgi:flagellar motor protein MotB